MKSGREQFVKEFSAPIYLMDYRIMTPVQLAQGAEHISHIGKFFWFRNSPC